MYITLWWYISSSNPVFAIAFTSSFLNFSKFAALKSISHIVHHRCVQTTSEANFRPLLKPVPANSHWMATQSYSIELWREYTQSSGAGFTPAAVNTHTCCSEQGCKDPLIHKILPTSNLRRDQFICPLPLRNSKAITTPRTEKASEEWLQMIVCVIREVQQGQFLY